MERKINRVTNREEILAIIAELDKAKGILGVFQPSEETQAMWRGRVRAGQAALAEQDFPGEAAALLTAAVIKHCAGKKMTEKQAQKLLQQYLSEKTAGKAWEKIGISPEKGLLYLHLACQAALVWAATSVATAISLEEWEGKGCPVCGAGPAFACVKEETGERVLVCGACLTQWPYRSVGCAFCGETAADKLRLLATKEFPGWSAAVCTSCRGYLKTADLAKLGGEPSWTLAALETVALDHGVAQWLESMAARETDKNLM